MKISCIVWVFFDKLLKSAQEIVVYTSVMPASRRTVWETLPHWVRVSLSILYCIIYIQFYCDIKTATDTQGTFWMNSLRTAWEILDLPLLNISLYSNLPLPHSVPYPIGLNRPFLYYVPLDCTYQGVYEPSQHKASEASFDFTSLAAYHGYHRFGLFSYICKMHAGCNG